MQCAHRILHLQAVLGDLLDLNRIAQVPPIPAGPLMPWSGELIRYADKETHRALRTSRNRNLLLPEEQNALYESTAAVFGLSVGSNAVEYLVRAGVVGKIIMADMDIISPSNLNRLPASQTEIGEKKLDVMAKKISIADPYLEQVHMPNGVSAENIDDLIHEHRPDFMVDAVDSLAIKAVIRAAGLRESVPVFMATDLDDKSILDIELYGKEEVVPFNGRLDDEAYRKLLEGAATQEEITGYTFALVGPENASERMLDSAFKAFGGELSGLPQLGTTAALGGIAVTRAARELILQNPDLTSGRSIVDTASFIAR